MSEIATAEEAWIEVEHWWSYEDLGGGCVGQAYYADVCIQIGGVRLCLPHDQAEEFAATVHRAAFAAAQGVGRIGHPPFAEHFVRRTRSDIGVDWIPTVVTSEINVERVGESFRVRLGGHEPDSPCVYLDDADAGSIAFALREAATETMRRNGDPLANFPNLAWDPPLDDRDERPEP